MEENNMHIVWNNYFDKIYCITHLPNDSRKEHLRKELERVGLWESPILEMRYTVACPYDNLILQFVRRQGTKRISYVNLSLENLKILKTSFLLGYSRILILEDDVSFLSNLQELNNCLASMPTDFNVFQFDKFLPSTRIEVWNEAIRNKRINDFWVDGTGLNFTSATMMSFDRHGMEEYIKVYENRLPAPDRIMAYTDCKIAIPIKNMCVQQLFSDAENLKMCSVEYLKECQTNNGVKVEDYGNHIAS